ncbi:hypothetical protein [Marinospirillum perlucidum]|uniref:hypothetical protein n=1 Tax=Marinospirillum perlucidum TaxID=1982602 RepID=UPI000DF1A04B|nr:hypothetical protein [Marinospirillum perlucidum]
MNFQRKLLLLVFLMLLGVLLWPKAEEAPAPETAIQDQGAAPSGSSLPPDPGFDDQDLAYLKDQGLARPIKQLLTDLLAHPDLLPQQEAGETPFVFVERQLRLLNRRWLLVDFTNTQRSGQALYAFEVTAEGQIEWQLLDYYLNEQAAEESS